MSAAGETSLLRQPKAVWAVAFACVISFMGIGLVDPILPAIAKDLQASKSDVSLLFTSYFAITGIAMLITGVVSSRIGAKRTLVAGLALIVIFSALAGASNTVDAIVGFRAGWGLGNALFIATALAVIVGAASGGVAGAIILYEAALGFGIATGPLVGGLLGGISWRGPFFGVAVLMTIALIAVLVLLPPTPKPERHSSVLDPLRALRHRGLLTVGLTALFYNFGFFTLLGFAPFPLDLGVHGLGFVFFGWGVVLAVCSVFLAPRLQHRFGTVPALYGVLILFALDLLCMGLFTHDQAAMITTIVIAGAFLGVNNTLVTEAVMKVSPVERPVASAGYSFIRFIGGAAAPYLAGRMSEAWNDHIPFYVGAAGVLIGVVVLASGHSIIAQVDRAETEVEIGTEPAGAPVLAAVDATESGALVVREAARLAAERGAAVEILHVRETDVLGDSGIDRESPAAAEAILRERLQAVRDEGVAVSGAVVHTIGDRSDVAGAIAGAARSRDAAIVVVAPSRSPHGLLQPGVVRDLQQRPEIQVRVATTDPSAPQASSVR